MIPNFGKCEKAIFYYQHLTSFCEVKIFGLDVWREKRRGKSMLVLAPQDLAICQPLTALEKLRFFGLLYGLTDTKLKRLEK
ncbi:MAG: hypothetical protein KJ950_09985 [Proteobacteria bacterium]|nr:hypothetical protein [Pseudomonadota bacterium]MBU1688985.1 hypothetical protein [Pseudomonadota bacterium]